MMYSAITVGREALTDLAAKGKISVEEDLFVEPCDWEPAEYGTDRVSIKGKTLAGHLFLSLMLQGAL